MAVVVRGVRELTKVLAAMDEAVDPEGVVDEVGAALLNRTRTRFLDQIDPDGQPWAPSQAALNRTGGGTLFDTGSLFRALTLLKVGEGQRAITVDPDASNTRTGIPVTDYAVKHQTGVDGLPRRQFLGFGDDDVRLAEEIVTARAKRILGS